MKVEVDADLCVGCSVCVDISPEVFDMPEETAVVKVQTVPAELEDAVRESAEACPSDAIIVEE